MNELTQTQNTANAIYSMSQYHKKPIAEKPLSTHPATLQNANLLWQPPTQQPCQSCNGIHQILQAISTTLQTLVSLVANLMGNQQTGTTGITHTESITAAPSVNQIDATTATQEGEKKKTGFFDRIKQWFSKAKDIGGTIKSIWDGVKGIFGKAKDGASGFLSKGKGIWDTVKGWFGSLF